MLTRNYRKPKVSDPVLREELAERGFTRVTELVGETGETVETLQEAFDLATNLIRNGTPGFITREHHEKRDFYLVYIGRPPHSAAIHVVLRWNQEPDKAYVPSKVRQRKGA